MLIVLGASSLPVAALDFTPQEGSRDMEGNRIPVVEFADGKRRVTWKPPAGWLFFGETSSLRLSSPDFSRASVDIAVLPGEKPGPLSDEDRKSLREKTIAEPPEAASDVRVLREAENPIILDQHGSFEVTVGYEFAGQNFEQSRIRLPLPNETLEVVITAPARDFQKFRGDFLRSMYSWTWSEAPR